MQFNVRHCIICLAEGTEIPKKLKRCSRCNLICYCSREHQILHWEDHQLFCNSIYQILKKRNIKYILDYNGPIKNSSKMRLDTAKVNISFELQNKMDRSFEMYERELINFARICEICHEYESMKLLDCDKCYAVSYCCIEHKIKDSENHNKVCNPLGLHYKFNHDLLVFNFNLPNVLNNAETLQKLPNDTFELMKLLTGKDVTKNPTTQQEWEQFSLISRASCIGTILYCIYKTTLQSLATDSMIIHIIGAERFDFIYFSDDILWLLNFCLPKVHNIHLKFIGPQLDDQECILTKNYNCKDGNIRNIHLSANKNLYKNYLQNTNINFYPHLIVSYNCGFSEFNTNPDENTWPLSISEITKLIDVPFIFTSYTKQEADFDANIVKGIAVKQKRIFNVIAEAEKNLFRDYRPLRNWESSPEEPIYYCNGYFSIFIFGHK